MSSVSLQDCFELFTQEETLEGDERPVSAMALSCFSLLRLYYHTMMNKHIALERMKSLFDVHIFVIIINVMDE